MENFTNEDPKIAKERKARMDMAKIDIELKLAGNEVEEAEKVLDSKKAELLEIEIKKIDIIIENSEKVSKYPSEEILDSNTANAFGYSINQKPLSRELFMHEIVVMNKWGIDPNEEIFNDDISPIDSINLMIEKYKDEYYFPDLEFYKFLLKNKKILDNPSEYTYCIGSIMKIQRHKEQKFCFPGIKYGTENERDFLENGIHMTRCQISNEISSEMGIVLVKRDKKE